MTQDEYGQMIVSLRKTNVYLQNTCSVPIAELTTMLLLAKLARGKGYVLPSEITKSLKLSPPAVSRMLHTLEKKGYLTKKVREEDHRYVKLEITEEGLNKIHEEMSHIREILARVQERMGEEDMDKFLYYMGEFSTYLSEEMRGRQ